ncbi:glyoxalase superfamily protein [Pseudomonas baetica]|uniref:glyoxalase superfamily protein n=1 Tax=Pseudomonas baetica TaxID=674054 RepID=UPI00240494EF|nr:glyoxalase superfamily protein [Pseudomonas baetica]MDF9778889.1 energy-coupling factor transporter ATP-binding protein EcfA2 [Pseudomonas baetica]
MTSETLKSRAKRLRPAVADMFKVSVTHSQALELVAKEENFPTWDAACASYGQFRKNPPTCFPRSTQSIQVSARRDQTRSMATIFEESETIPQELHRLLDQSDSRGALVLICGATGQGKSTTANVVINDLLRANLNTNEPTLIVDVGLGSETCLDFPLGQRLVLVDEIRSARLAFEVVALAQAGVKVVATLHGKPGIDRLRVLLRQFGIGEVFLDGLIAEGQILSIDQELVWPDVAMQIQSNRERLELILRQHGFDESNVNNLVERGPQAVLDAVLQKGVPGQS